MTRRITSTANSNSTKGLRGALLAIGLGVSLLAAGLTGSAAEARVTEEQRATPEGRQCGRIQDYYDELRADLARASTPQEEASIRAQMQVVRLRWEESGCQARFGSIRTWFEIIADNRIDPSGLSNELNPDSQPEPQQPTVAQFSHSLSRR